MINFLTRMFFDIIAWMKSSLGQFVLFVFAPIVAFFTFVLNALANLQAHYSALIDKGLSAGTATELTLGTSFGIANSLVPLDLMMTYCTLLFSMSLVGLVYRAVKSWIPTLA